ncbi:hypothetical protein WR25_11504 [Diploscapter pachys]|uniref:Ketoreductase (KR) domain-containing protein n=1 Tax=Diploscapter pachys TaxID=2018661 RepID=A0A2A2L788_9BILA|nr:hypothetical protein WR25_11504 [Diploscapter pachys]
MSPYSVLVTGANRGIGLALVKEFLKRKDIQVVIATARDPAKADSLKEISDARLRLVQMDLSNDESIRNSYSEVDKIVGSHGLNVLLNNAGALIKYSTSGEVDRSKLVEQFQTNVFGVVIATQTYLPLLRKAAFLKSDDSFSIDRAAILQISSGYGSITNNDRGSAGIGAAAYKASKVA